VSAPDAAALPWPRLLGIDGAAPNAVELAGLALEPQPDGALQVRIARFTARGVRLQLGRASADVDDLVLTGVRLTLGAGTPPALQALAVERVQVQAARLDSGAPLAMPAPAAAPADDPWQLDALAGLYGSLRAFVTDAAWVVDAEVSVPIQRGRIDFDAVEVAHVGPDSRMGASHLGVYVDAPNGRQYLYTFARPVVPGVTFERRGLGFGPFVATVARSSCSRSPSRCCATPRAARRRAGCRTTSRPPSRAPGSTPSCAWATARSARRGAGSCCRARPRAPTCWCCSRPP
jgi:hypothetical protein